MNIAVDVENRLREQTLDRIPIGATNRDVLVAAGVSPEHVAEFGEYLVFVTNEMLRIGANPCDVLQEGVRIGIAYTASQGAQ